MESLIGYGSDDEVESDRYGNHHSTVGGGCAGTRRREDDTNYDEVNMDLSEDSQADESEPELPQAVSSSRHSSRDDRRNSDDSRDRQRERERFERSERPDRLERDDRRERQRESPMRSRSDRSDRRSPRSDERHRSDRNDRGRGSYESSSSRRGLLGEKPDEKVPALMDLKPFSSEPHLIGERRSHDARDAVSPRFVDRDRRDRDRERDRDKDRHSRRSEEKRSGHRHSDRRERSRSRGRPYPSSGSHSSSSERRGSPPSSGDYKPSSYKVNKKLEVMEKMGLQIKTPDGSMATAQQLRAAAGDTVGSSSSLPSYYNQTGMNANKVLDQVQKRKLLWSHKTKSDADEAAKWTGTRFAQDSDGKQATKFMRLMGIKEPAAAKPDNPDATADPIKKQEELFQAMQAQYEVARATTHTMRGVGLGFQRGQF